MKALKKVLAANQISQAIAAVALSFLSGCGADAFVTASRVEEGVSPGSFTIPAKVDILLVQDNSGSMQEVYGELQQQIPPFLAGLEQSGWDYHFATIPLLNDRPVNQVLASRHDINWGSQWTPAYPGLTASSPGPGQISPSVFRRPENYNFIMALDTTNQQQSTEPGFQTIKSALQTRLPSTGFLRDDALLVVFVMGNGEDGSGVTYRQLNGFSVPTNDEASFQNYLSFFKGFRTAGQLRFDSAVAAYKGTCRNGNSYHGARYERMAGELYGKRYDICYYPISSIVDNLKSSLQERRIAMRTRYVFIAREPEPSTIVVYKNGTAVPQSSTNGWTYVGYQSNIYVIDSPFPMNRGSGYAIELHGSAKLIGTDTVSVGFKDKGLRDTAVKN